MRGDSETQDMLKTLDEGVAIEVSDHPGSKRQHAVTVLVNNQDYLRWGLQNIARNMGKTAKEMGGLNPMKIMVSMMAKVLNHPNAWRIIVAQVAGLTDEAFDAHWPDIKAIADEIDGAPIATQQLVEQGS